MAPNLPHIDGYRVLHQVDTVHDEWWAGLRLGDRGPARVLVQGWRIGMLGLGCGDDTEPDRFEAYLQRAKGFVHPECLRLREIGRADGFLFASYDYELPFDGRSLLKRLRECGRGPLSAALACTIAHRAGLALHAMHQHTDSRRSALHGAIDLSSIWVTAEGGVRLTGLPDLGDRPRRFNRHHIPFYSPEALRGRAERRSDVYSLAVAVWELLTGQPLVAEGRSDFETMERVLAGVARDPREHQSDIPPGVAAAIVQALSPDPAQRPPDGGALSAALARAAFGGPNVQGPAQLSAFVRELFPEELPRDAARWASALAALRSR